MKKHFAYLTGVGLSTVLLLESCQKEDDATSALLGRRWMLTEVDGTSLMVSSYSLDYDSYIEFVGAGNAARGLAACDGFSARFAAGSQRLSITQLSARQGCSPFSNRYLAALPQTTRYEIAGRTLRLYDASAPKPRLVFEAAP